MLQLCRPQHTRGGRNNRVEAKREKLPLQQQHSPRPAQVRAAKLSPAKLSPAKPSSGVWACQETSASTQPMRYPPLLPALKAPQGATKCHQDSKNTSVTSPLLLQSPEKNHHIPKQQSRNHKCMQETFPLS